MEYCHTRKFTLRHTDFDFKDELKPSALLGLVQEAAASSADELGFGYLALKSQGYGFIIVNNYCKLLRPVRLGERLTVETWPMPPRHVIFERTSRVLGEDGTPAALFATRWCLVDLQTFGLLTADKLGEVNTNCPYRGERATEVAVWKIPKLGEGGREVYTMQVLNEHCDHYRHANNTRYADFYFNCFTMEELSARRVTDFQIAYGKQAKEGQTLSLWREDLADRTICEIRCGGETLSQCKIIFEEGNRS